MARTSKRPVVTGQISKNNATVLFLIIGKTHPTIVKNEGEEYRNKLQQLIIALHLQNHVQFVNQFLSLDILLEYLQMTDIYLFTSKDPHQAVSGTFSYALSCGCPIISTPIPHSLEVLQSEVGVMIDFENEQQLAKACAILQVPLDLLKRCIISKEFGVGSVALINLRPEEAIAMRNSLCTGLYAKLFDWIVNKSNMQLKSEAGESKDLYIGVLDIFGFEIFETNSFEQFW
jgi:hypothetical protein